MDIINLLINHRELLFMYFYFFAKIVLVEKSIMVHGDKKVKSQLCHAKIVKEPRKYCLRACAREAVHNVEK